ncbi:MAG: response regulator transcription factor [Rhodocyclaceae bacterium]|nr:response regulator transcription factor [Rhodocyclaceae bacterium]MBP6280037.1 response regulator transcription factor [Rhodocyclaceae bacterium]
MIEDDPRLSALVVEYLAESGFEVTTAATATMGLQAASSSKFDALILDLMLPDIDGLEVCRRLRANEAKALPILMLTARGDATDRVVGLEMGADDYLPKPFEPRELLARLRAILRRTASSAANAERDAKGRNESETLVDILRFGRLEIDRGAREVRLDGQLCDLTSHQFVLLRTLAENAGRVLSREFLMESATGESLEAFDRSIDVHVSRVRATIEDDPKQPRRIITVRGAGYVFARQQN